MIAALATDALSPLFFGSIPLLLIGAYLQKSATQSDSASPDPLPPPDLLKAKRVSGFIFSMDIRGYTDLASRNADEKVGEFTTRYLSMVNRIISDCGGFVHKTSGDGHLISFGIMHGASGGDHATQFRKMVEAYDRIVRAAAEIAESTLAECAVSLGAAIDFGEIDVRVVNHTSTKIELDIFGQPIIRCARLEAHTKIIRENFQESSSLLIISSSAAAFVDDNSKFIRYQTLFKPVRDFPDIQWFLVKPYDHGRRSTGPLGLQSIA